MTIVDAVGMIGKTATLRLGRLMVRVLIKNTKQVYGRIRFDVTPCSGEGVDTVDQDRIIDVL
jgi:hypothetical protein